MDHSNLRPGDSVTILDTSNNKDLHGTVRQHLSAGRVSVWCARFKTFMVFDRDGITNRGRFKLKEAR